MTIPDFQAFMLPLLRLAADGKEHTIQEALEHLANEFKLSPEDLEALVPSGRATVFRNRVSWARTYLTKAGLLEAPKRSHFRITELGKEVLKTQVAQIDVKFLLQFPQFKEFKSKHIKTLPEKNNEEPEESPKTPEELMEEAYQRIRAQLAQDLLQTIKQCSANFFERLVVDLLVKMGYGGSHRDAARAVGKSGDGGIDGIIDEDRLGLETIYIQAKHWDGPVGSPEIQKFVGALAGKKAKKGVFITTSTFTQNAIDYVTKVDHKIVLIDGQRLAELMIDYEVGVTTILNYPIKQIDRDYFSED
ncbi:MAG: restriction endonuclease [Thermanaerothrix sp.]|uniref:restriction endonuclease n=1 Tax=Thermanaerothrix sp. TaxID=2972675 RepID=UPI003C7D8BFA